MQISSLPHRDRQSVPKDSRLKNTKPISKRYQICKKKKGNKKRKKNDQYEKQMIVCEYDKSTKYKTNNDNKDIKT